MRRLERSLGFKVHFKAIIQPFDKASTTPHVFSKISKQYFFKNRKRFNENFDRWRKVNGIPFSSPMARINKLGHAGLICRYMWGRKICLRQLSIHLATNRFSDNPGHSSCFLLGKTSFDSTSDDVVLPPCPLCAKRSDNQGLIDGKECILQEGDLIAFWFLACLWLV
ncbi:hypothetical protein KEM60_00256 [Austwickia sp. TVS 96-490-7B]|nr:hypothetical protein [Austwickia sp. TVS 96-490-7B]